MALRTLVSVHLNTKILGIGHCAKFLIKNIQQFLFNIKSTLNNYYDDDNYVTVCNEIEKVIDKMLILSYILSCDQSKHSKISNFFNQKPLLTLYG